MKQKASVSCLPRSAFHNGPCCGVTIVASPKPSDLGSLPSIVVDDGVRMRV